MITDRILIGEAEFRNKRTSFGIKIDDLRRHLYTIGMTGAGKTTLLDTMAIHHIQNGMGVGVIDPHGEFAERLLSFVPKERIDEVVYINPSDTDFPIAFNVMENVAFDFRHNVASSMLAVFKKIWPDVWSARMEYILNNTFLALLEFPDSTLLGINRMLSDKSYRKKMVDELQDPVVKAFWTNEFARYNEKFQTEAIAPIQNKVGQFTANPLVRNIIGQVKSKINLREVMDSGKILIIRLPVGLLGETNSQLLGGLLVTKIQQAAMSRIDVPESQRRDFTLIIDEFQNFANESFVKILAEARKYHLSLVIGHQYIEQVPEEITAGIFGNVGTIINFRVGPKDAEFIEPQYEPYLTVQDLVNLPNHYFYAKLLVEGISSTPFLASTLRPPETPNESFREDIVKLSQLKYCTNRKIVDADIAEWIKPIEGEEIIDERRSSRAGSDFASQSGVLFEAKCSSCGTDVRVPFQPDGTRPVYCKNCLKKVQRERDLRKLIESDENLKASLTKPTPNRQNSSNNSFGPLKNNDLSSPRQFVKPMPKETRRVAQPAKENSSLRDLLKAVVSQDSSVKESSLSAIQPETISEDLSSQNQDNNQV